MTQRERRLYLIQEMLREQPEYAGVEIPEDEREQKILLRSLFNIRMPKPVTSYFLEVQDAYLIFIRSMAYRICIRAVFILMIR